MADRLVLLRKGQLSAIETADFAADAGTHNFVEARQDVERLLDHESPIVRHDALGTMAYEWGLSSRVDRILEMLVSDEDRDCRRQAAAALGSLLRGQRSEHVLDALVRTARNTEESMDVRAFAYSSALDVIGVSRAIQPNPVGLHVSPDELLALDEYLKGLQ